MQAISEVQYRRMNHTQKKKPPQKIQVYPTVKI